MNNEQGQLNAVKDALRRVAGGQMKLVNTKTAEFFIGYIEFIKLRKGGNSLLMLKEWINAQPTTEPCEQM